MAIDAVDLFKRADAEWESGHNKKAFDLFLKAALHGESSAQHNVGYFYDVGIGTKKNIKKALFWYKKAWRNDRQTGTCINIAKLYVARKNFRVAMGWWNKAIKKGDGDAALELAKFYLGKKNRRDQNKAVALLKKARKFSRISETAAEEISEILRMKTEM
jgi:TPR repeat protein